ncbi:ABC transporter permease [Demequina sp. NBRC 110054]|uniref:ABC transporter permease n=1 Tax=Demequina sp. NBRC 110054 TaxID=1570343 RepID=UPI0009FF8D10|nr:ABC transporter permease [Demequina sp. NBRC 110054]
MLLKLLSRTGILLASTLVGSMIVFGLLAVLPGDPATVALGVNATPEAVAQLQQEFGTDRPLVVQYLDWLGGILQGDFGTSYVTGADIAQQIGQRIAVTGWLVGTSLVLTILIAVPLGVLAAVRQRKASGTVLAAMSQFGVAVPSFIAALLLINIFAVRLGWVPSGGWTAPVEDPAEFLRKLILPVVSIGLVQGAVLSRYVRSAALEIMREDFIRTARAKGLTPLRAFIKHGSRNAAVPVVTVIGLQVAGLLVDTIVVERVFVIPGLGSLLFDGLANRDLLLVQGIALIIVCLILVLNYIVDLLYIVIDPRLRRQLA